MTVDVDPPRSRRSRTLSARPWRVAHQSSRQGRSPWRHTDGPRADWWCLPPAPRTWRANCPRRG